MNAPKTVRDVVEQIVVETATPRETAVALHDYVRDTVRFGFNKYFDAAPPDYTLNCGYGHCNPKSRLMVVLFRAAGLESYQHFVVIRKEILKGAIPASRYWMIPSELSHSYVDVKVDDTWCAIDSYIVDTPLLRGAQAKLTEEGRRLGYGVRDNSVNTWDGVTDAFSQYDESLLLEDHRRIDDLDAFFESAAYRNHVLGLRFNTMFQLMGESGVAPMNQHVDKIRGSAS